MSTCKGTYRDEWVPSDVGVLVLVGGGADPLVTHVRSSACDHQHLPHYMSQCGEFEPVRSGFEPPPEPPRGHRLPMMPFDWDPIFDRLAIGESIYSILKDYASRPLSTEPVLD